MSSSIWNHFEKMPGMMAKCVLCKKMYSYKTSSTNLKKHLNYKHLSVYQVLFNTKQTKFSKANVATKRRLASVAQDEAEDKISLLSVISPNILQQPMVKISASVSPEVDEKRKEMIDNQLLQMIIQDYQPFSIVEDEGFKCFVEVLNPNYELPKRKLISGTLIPDRYLDCKNKIMQLVQQARSVCLTIDCWTSIDMDSYFAVTAHFFIDFELKTVLLHCEQFSDSHRADALAVALKVIASEWGITNKITLVVSDNTGNIINAIQKTGWPFFGCFLHKLNLIIEKALKKIEFIVDKVKTIVSHFKKNNLATETLIKHQIDFEKKSEFLRLVQCVPTRWNSVFYMLERFLRLRVALEAVLPNLKANLPVITVEMWEIIRHVSLILMPFEEVTQVMNGAHYLTASLAFVIVDGLKNVLSVMKTKDIFGPAKDFLGTLEEGMNNYFPKTDVEDNTLLGVCTVLDPRFKIHAFVNSNDVEVAPSEETIQRMRRAHLIKEHILELVKLKLREKRDTSKLNAPTCWSTSTTDDMEAISIWGKIDKTIAASVTSDDITNKAKNELDMFLNEEVMPRDSSPWVWWKSHAFVYPNLAEIFHEQCHIVVTSVECDRVLTKAGNFMSQKRARLSRKHTAELVFLKSNDSYC